LANKNQHFNIDQGQKKGGWTALPDARNPLLLQQDTPLKSACSFTECKDGIFFSCEGRITGCISGMSVYMLTVCSGNVISEKEAAMSSTQSNSEAVRGLLAVRRDLATAVAARKGVAPGTEGVAEGGLRGGARGSGPGGLMHAWSIGTTQATAPEFEKAGPKETCPPEVYIG
jgi:hypothetical protein